MTSVAAQLAVVRELEKRVKELKDEINTEFLRTLEPGDAKAALLDDGTRLGKVHKTVGSMTVRVTDEHELARWVLAHFPTEVETVHSIRPAFMNKLKSQVREHGNAFDPSTGEVIPGIELREGKPYISYRAEKGADDVIADRWPELAGDVLTLPPGEDT